MNRTFRVWIVGVFLFAGCATAPAHLPAPVEKKDIPAPVVAEEKNIQIGPYPFEDRDLLLEGVLLLGRSGLPDPHKARSIFISLIQRYPESRWRSAAEAFIRLIDERDELEESRNRNLLMLQQTETEKSRALQENSRLKKTIQDLTEKFQAATATLTHENEQLKKDIQRLKALEIELQKRERMLR